MLLKDLYNKKYIEHLSNNLSLNYEKFHRDKFIEDIFINVFYDMEFKQRLDHICKVLKLNLSNDYTTDINILKKTFIMMDTYRLENLIFQGYVGLYGLDFFHISMEALKCFTINCSSEFAIREFILKYPKETMSEMLKWSKNSHIDIRRLSTEGCRPILPWGVTLHKFKINPKPILRILYSLRNEEDKYIQKSMANNLNDISKSNPKIIEYITKKYINKSPSINWILKHGCRTLLKNSNRKILDLFGFAQISKFELSNFTLSNVVNMEDNLEFSFKLKLEKGFNHIRLEYVIYFLRKNNSYYKKVFQIKQRSIDENGNIFILKQHSFKTITTRKYYKGKHYLQLVLNGEPIIKKAFILK